MIRFGLWTRSITVCLLVTAAVAADDLPPLSEISVTSSLDGSRQPSRTWIPKRASQRPTPLFVFLHSWSGDYRQDNSAWLKEAVARGWIFLHPNFRGRNDTPAACGSKLARSDILDAIDWVTDKYKVDPARIYLAGSSGGGHTVAYTHLRANETHA